MADSKKQLKRERNGEDVHEHLPFDEALRRLVNTPPKHLKAAKRAKPKSATESKRADS